MINLVKNELIKIFSKKAIYIYTTIVCVMIVGVAMLSKASMDTSSEFYSGYAEGLKESIKDYDLTDQDQLRMFVGDKVNLEFYYLIKDFDMNSAERYFADENIFPLLKEKYDLEYIDKNVEAANLVQIEIDELVKELNNFDFMKYIKEEKIELEDEIKLTEQLLLSDSDNEEIKNYLDNLKNKLWCLNYRIDNKIPYSYESASELVDTYETSYGSYQGIVKDESLIKNRNELLDKREIESNYYVSKYKLENKMLEDNQDVIDYIVGGFNYVDGLVVCAIIVIAGSIISEEFNKGTIKQLLIKPFSRAKILTSKIIACIIALFVFLLVYETVYVLATCYEYSDFTSVLGSNVVYDFNIRAAKEVSIIGQSIYGLLSVMPAYLIILLVILFVGTLTTSAVAAIVSGFGLYLGADLVSFVLKEELLAFMPFSTWDLSRYMYGGLSTNKFASLGTSVIVNVITIIVLLVLTYFVFKYKDIKNQ